MAASTCSRSAWVSGTMATSPAAGGAAASRAPAAAGESTAAAPEAAASEPSAASAEAAGAADPHAGQPRPPDPAPPPAAAVQDHDQNDPGEHHEEWRQRLDLVLRGRSGDRLVGAFDHCENPV